MFVHKNTNFWIRLLSNAIDMLITIAFMVGMYLIIIFQKETSNIEYIAFVVINMSYLIVYFIFFPILAFGSTLGQHITNLKMITDELKTIRNRDVLSRNILGVWYWILIFLLYLAFFAETDLKTVIQTEQNQRTISQNIGIAFIGTLSSNWFLIMFINYAVLLFSKKKLALIDRVSKTRVVYKKQIFLEQEKEILLIPRKITRRKIIYHNKNLKGE